MTRPRTARAGGPSDRRAQARHGLQGNSWDAARLVHQRLRELGLVDLVVPVAPVAHHVHHHVRLPALPPVRGQLADVHHRLTARPRAAQRTARRARPARVAASPGASTQRGGIDERGIVDASPAPHSALASCLASADAASPLLVAQQHAAESGCGRRLRKSRQTRRLAGMLPDLERQRTPSAHGCLAVRIPPASSQLSASVGRAAWRAAAGRARASTSSPLTWKMGALSALATSVQYALERLLRGSVVKATCARRPGSRVIPYPTTAGAPVCGRPGPLAPREPQPRSAQVWHAALPRRHTLTKRAELRALLHAPRQRTRGRDPRAGRTEVRLGAGRPAACEARRSVRPRAGQRWIVAQTGRAPGGGTPGC